jgi:hypothetical protein
MWRGSDENSLGVGFGRLTRLNRVKHRLASRFGIGYGEELVGYAREVGRSDRKPGLGQKGEAGWAERDFEPMKPREIQKRVYYYLDLIQIQTDSNSNER